MPLVYADSFALYTTVTQRFTSAVGLFSISNSGGDQNNGVLGFFDSGIVTRQISPLVNVGTGFSFETNTPPAGAGQGDIFTIWPDLLGPAARLSIGPSGTLVVTIGSSVSVSANGLWMQNSWNNIALEVTSSWLAGVMNVVVAVFFNGVLVIVASGTVNTATTTFNYLKFEWHQGGQSGNFGNWWVSDGGFIGDATVTAAVPNGAGFKSQWTPSSGQNWQCVDTIPAGSGSALVSGTALGQEDEYAFAAMPVPTGGFISGVQENLFIQGTDPSGDKVNFLVNVSGTEFLFNAQSVPSTYTFLSEMITTNPSNGNPWGNSDIGGAVTQFGQEVAGL